MTFLLTLTFILGALIAGVYLFIKRIYSYWYRKGVEYIEPNFFYGNIKEMVHGKISTGDLFKKFYDDLKSRGLKFGGCYTFFSPVLIIVDLDLTKNILLKDFDNFVNRGMYYNEKMDPLSAHLFSLEDERWKNLRAKLTPTFTSGKLKMMFPTLVACSFGIEDILNEYSVIQDAVDIKEVCSRYATDAIGSVAFGIDCNSLKNPDSKFRQWERQLFKEGVRGILQAIALLALSNRFLHAISYKIISKSTEDFLRNIVRETMEYREKNNVYRKDFMHLLLQLKNRGEVTEDTSIIKEGSKTKDSDTLSFNEIAAECFVFFIAGYESSATNMTFTLLELALNQDMQDNLRGEINTVLKKHDMQFTYDSIMEMKYLEKVVDGIHHDPEYYPDPDKFDPERFNKENTAARHPFAYMPFGEGPRMCIGARYGLLQSKVGIIAIIKNFEVTLNEKTKTPIRYAKTGIIPRIEGGVWLNVTKIQ
ncbi:probable cytochrome P450 6a23 isoform X2 [Leptinotarsa decemlineata]|uniref:probable cytochrome P450 6a23 isoform X2 n=1 Tax=Leptinotarsa decemlineata TaxID=7539 RepID=UPI003D30A7A6